VRETLWLSCAAKTCCYTAAVIPTGTDVHRIARALDLPPPSFLVYFETSVPRRDAFALDRSARRFRWMLAKNPALSLDGRPGCGFLLRTRTGEHRCGLGDLRPVGCRVFPAMLRDGIVSVQPSPGCTCRPWSLADLDTAAERPGLEAGEADGERYGEVVSRWNEAVEREGAGRPRRFDEYCDYVLDAYDLMEAGAAAGGVPAPT
jgi:hypothetical protein